MYGGDMYGGEMYGGIVGYNNLLNSLKIKLFNM